MTSVGVTASALPNPMVDFAEDDLPGFTTADPGGPVCMLNLVRFHPAGGRELFARYWEAVLPVGARYGAELVYFGDGAVPLVSGAGRGWDAVLIVRYPSRQAFVDTVTDPDYLAAAHLRTEALIEAVLQPTTSVVG